MMVFDMRTLERVDKKDETYVRLPIYPMEESTARRACPVCDCVFIRDGHPTCSCCALDDDESEV